MKQMRMKRTNRFSIGFGPSEVLRLRLLFPSSERNVTSRVQRVARIDPHFDPGVPRAGLDHPPTARQEEWPQTKSRKIQHSQKRKRDSDHGTIRIRTTRPSRFKRDEDQATSSLIQRPSINRKASSSGNGVSRNRRIASSTSYFTRRNSIVSPSKTTYEARGSPSRG